MSREPETTPPDCAEYAARIARIIFPGLIDNVARQELQCLLIGLANEIKRRTLED